MLKQLIAIFIVTVCTGIAFAQETPTPTPLPVEDNITMVLIPFTMVVEDTEISGVLPADWDMIQPGTAIRNDNDGINATYILHIVAPDTPLDEALQPLLVPLELETLPEESTSYESQNFNWTLYTIAYEPPQYEGDALQVLVATAELDETAYIIVLQTYPEEVDSLYESVLLPTLDTFGLPLTEINAYLGIPEFTTVDIEQFAIQADVPTSWQNVNPGAYMRGASQTDFTTLLIQTSPDLSEREFADLLRETLHIPEDLPDEGELLVLDNFNWTVYRMDFDAQGTAVTLQIATASDGERTLMVALLSSAEEADDLMQTILLPILAQVKGT